MSTASARRWAEQLESSGIERETMLWRLLRIGSAPYFVLGNDRRTGRPARYRIASPWDWRDQFELVDFSVTPADAGQPRVDWAGTYRTRSDGADRTRCTATSRSAGATADSPILPRRRSTSTRPCRSCPATTRCRADESQPTSWSVAR